MPRLLGGGRPDLPGRGLQLRRAPLGGGASLDAGSGAPDLAFPSVNGNVNAAVADGAGGFYIGGNFTLVGGVPRGTSPTSARAAR